MPSTYTSNNALTLQAFNENPSTWGSINNSVISLIDASLDGIEAVDVAGSTPTATLTIADGASSQARSRVLNFTGARTVTNITVTIGPNTVEKIYWVKNSTTGGFSVILAQGSGSTVTIAPGAWALVFLDGAGSGAGVTTLTSFAMAGSSSGITILQPSAAASGTLTLPAATDTLVGRATTDTLSNKTLTAPILGTPASGTLSNCTGLPIATGVSGLATGVATFLATPTSANLAAALTDETGTGASVFATSPTLATPTITTNATVPLVIGGTGTTSTLSLRSTSGVGATGSAIIFQTGTNGSTEAARIINSGNFGVGATAPAQKLEVYGATSLPATSGTTQNGLVRIASTATNAIDMGLSNASPFGAWIQASNVTSLATTYPLLLNPNGGNVGIATPSPKQALHVAGQGLFTQSAVSFDPGDAAGPAVRVGYSSSGDFGYLVSTETGVAVKRLQLASSTAEFITAGAERMRVDSVGLKIGGTADRATTAGTNQLMIFNGTAPVGTLANGCSFYSTAGEMRVMDAAGNATLLSPHDSATNEWIYDSTHTPTGKRLRISVEKLLRFVNDHFGLDCVMEEE